MKIRIPLEQRFWNYVQKTDSCWLWTGAQTWGGYGVIQSGSRKGKIVRAHRLSYVMHKGEFDEVLSVCHTCDNPPCVNPDHLFLGTRSDNMQDCSAKGRTRGNNYRGEDHHQAKLNDESVVWIRTAYAKGGTSLNQLAREFGVSKRSILNIVHRRVWKHI